MDSNNKYQIIWIKLSDGREIQATVKPFCKPGDRLDIVGFKVSEHLELEQDTYWGNPSPIKPSPPKVEGSIDKFAIEL